MLEDYYETDTVSWDGRQFTAINPNFLKSEQEKVKKMTYVEAIDYILFDSRWSIAFRNIGWIRKEDDKAVTYTLDRSAFRYYRSRRRYIDGKDKAVLSIDKSGTNPTYKRVIFGTIRYDDGKTVEIAPRVITYSGDDAINEVTGGLWNALAVGV